MDKPHIDPSASSPVDDALSVIVNVDSAIEFSRRQSGTQTAYVAKDRRTGKYYRFGVREYHAATLMNGRRTLREIHEELTRDGLPWTAVDVLEFARELTKHRLAMVVTLPPQTTASTVAGPTPDAASASQAGTPTSATETAAGAQPNQSVWAVAIRLMTKLLTQRFPIVDGDRVATKLAPAIGPLFSTPATIGWALFVVTGVGVAWSNWDGFSTEIRRVFDQQLWLVMIGIWCVLKVIHECGHAVCAKRHGVHVGKMGVMLFLFAPLAYVDVTDAWKLVRRRDRVQIALAGIYLELLIGAAAAWIWWSAPVGFTKHLAAQVFLVAGPATLLVNANPLLRLDGYYVLSDLLEIPNLREQGRRRLTGLLEYVFFRLPPAPSVLNGWRRDFAMLHAFCSVVFQVVWMSGLIIGISAWAQGFGILLAAVAAFCWGLLPLIRWMYKIWTLQPREGWVLNVYQRRLIALATFAFLMVHYATVNTSPLARRVPVVVQFQNEQIARAPVDAFVASVFVRCGDRVEAGTLLMELEQPEILLKRDQLIDRRDVESAKAIQHRRRGEVALENIATQNADSLQRQIAEIEEQIVSMRITAERDGRITTPVTDRLLGSYVRQGDELLRVADPQEKEILAVVAEDSLEAYRNAASEGRIANIRLRGGVTIKTTLQALRPSASRVLPHPAMAATVGGPLAVEIHGESDSTELVNPQLRSVLPLDPLTSLSVESGQVGRLTIPDDRTLLSRAWDRVRVQ